MSGTMAIEGKKITMAPFVPYDRRAYFYSLLAACLEISDETLAPTALARFQAVFRKVGAGAAATFHRDEGKGSTMLAALERSSSEAATPLQAFTAAFGPLTVSEEILLEAIGEQQDVGGMVKGLRSLALLVVAETP